MHELVLSVWVSVCTPDDVQRCCVRQYHCSWSSDWLALATFFLAPTMRADVLVLVTDCKEDSVKEKSAECTKVFGRLRSTQDRRDTE